MNEDKSMMSSCLSQETKQLFDAFTFDHPLDTEVIELIYELHDSIRDDDDDYEIFRYSHNIDNLWFLLISKSIKCLRYYDKREPFMKNDGKKPKAYGMDDLNEYYKKYKKFENMLYGSGQYYRDHVIHVFRTWLSGIECMVKNNGAFLKLVAIREKETVELNYAEVLCIWTIIALTHDLGYPLEKAKDIIGATRSMVSTFVTNPDISMDLSFHGVQNYMNDFIVRLMSSKMVYSGTETDDNGGEKTDDNGGEKTGDNGDEIKKYVARLQPKYYFKFQKSLEKTEHGIISTLIIYKLLTYFLESDYNINEDYKFDPEDRRQFYIRREILRAIASHTCADVYHMYMGSFAFLLIIADNTQEWGRKYISELYIPSGIEYEPGETIFNISPDLTHISHKCEVSESVRIPEKKGSNSVEKLLLQLRDQAMYYVIIFRDGQDTIKRDFSFLREFSIVYDSAPNIRLKISLTIPNDSASTLKGEIEYSGNQAKNQVFGEDFFKGLSGQLNFDVNWKVFDASNNEADKWQADTWRKGEFFMGLTN
ncbi:MAG: hypothetical protein FWH55_03875 [Oscillospiraceae bacterium]|nr:hypothetical protein [Oscillospiraceae bacterium]